MRGKAIRRDGCIGLRRDHPRVCGEKYQLGVVKPLHEGSPPRMRGKAYKGADQTTRRGITPAYAGKSTVKNPDFVPVWDHPRVCGEKGVTKMFLCGVQGSPPRMRGKAAYYKARAQQDRITPAYAGKSCGYFVVCRYLQDHPRVCGEKLSPALEKSPSRGSPPRMRGKVLPRAVLGPASGITPAYAGKRLVVQRYCPLVRDHPRVCGEK